MSSGARIDKFAARRVWALVLSDPGTPSKVACGAWSCLNRYSTRILWCLTGLTSVVYLLGDTVVKSRLLYNIPIGVLAAYGIIYVDELKVDSRLKVALKVAVLITLVSYFFRDLVNLV